LGGLQYLGREEMVADAVAIEPVSSLQIRKMQGVFTKMQGADALNPPKSFLISEAWSEFSLLAEQRGYSFQQRE
jgi:hypothetical protein